MPDQGAPISLIQNSFTTGEIAPSLYGRTDLQKYHSGVAFLRNFYVDYKGGVTTKPGSQFIGHAGSNGFARLIPFQFSAAVGQTYMLVFTDRKMRVIKNPGGPAYPNSSNAGYVLSGGVPYELATPYLEADLRGLHYMQVADIVRITAHGYARMELKRLADNNWTLTSITTTPSIAAPVISSITISDLPAGSTDPQTTRYMYAVSAVDDNGVESLPSVPFVSGPGVNVAITLGTVTVFWTPVANASFYKVYKALTTSGDKLPNPSEQLGFAGFAYGTIFSDSNVVPDFTKGPLQDDDPFNSAGLTGYHITASSGDWPVGTTTVSVTDGTGSGAVVYPILDNNTAGGTGSIIGLYIARPGKNYTAPTITAAGGGTTFTATLTVGPTTGIEPDVVGLVQQRIIYASTDNAPNSIFAGRPGGSDDFRTSNPVVDSDAFNFDIASQQVSDILWLRAMPGGLVIGTNSGIVQLTGGSSSPSNPAAITPVNAVVVPQSNYGAADIPPIVIDYDILFVTPLGLVIDLQYNFFVNIFTGSDITIMSSHLFDTARIVDWAYQDAPRKIVWAITNEGEMLSLTFLKTQEVQGWAHHDTQGLYESIAVVQEGATQAVYVSVQRFENAQRFIERLSGSIWKQRSDAWQLDCALSTTPTFPNTRILAATGTGTNVLVIAEAPAFAPGDINKRLTSGSAYGIVVGYTDSTHIHINIHNPFPITDTGVGAIIQPGEWNLAPLVATISGLSHLESATVYALVDGVPQGPFVVSGGLITLSSPGALVVVGLPFRCQLQPLYIDVGGDTTVQGRRKKVAAASVRVLNAAGLKYGISFSAMKPWVGGVSSTDPQLELPYRRPDLYSGDQRVVLDQYFTVGGWVCVQQDQPLPAQILSIEPEYAQGDTR